MTLRHCAPNCPPNLDRPRDVPIQAAFCVKQQGISAHAPQNRQERGSRGMRDRGIRVKRSPTVRRPDTHRLIGTGSRPLCMTKAARLSAPCRSFASLSASASSHPEAFSSLTRSENVLCAFRAFVQRFWKLSFCGGPSARGIDRTGRRIHRRTGCGQRAAQVAVAKAGRRLDEISPCGIRKLGQLDALQALIDEARTELGETDGKDG